MPTNVSIIPAIRFKGKRYPLERYGFNKSVLEKDAKKFRSLGYKAIVRTFKGKKPFHALYTRRPETFLRKKR